MCFQQINYAVYILLAINSNELVYFSSPLIVYLLRLFSHRVSQLAHLPEFDVELEISFWSLFRIVQKYLYPSCLDMVRWHFTTWVVGPVCHRDKRGKSQREKTCRDQHKMTSLKEINVGCAVETLRYRFLPNNSSRCEAFSWSPASVWESSFL